MLLNIILFFSVFLAGVIISSCKEELRQEYLPEYEKFYHSRTKRDTAASCKDSRLIINLTKESTKVKIMSKSGEELFSSDDSKLSLEKMNLLLMEYKPNLAESPRHNKSDIIIITQKFDAGEVHTLLREGNITIFLMGNESAFGKLKKIESFCARILDWQIDLDEKMDLNKLDRFNHTALLWATRIGSIDAVKVLVEKGANVNKPGAFDVTPLHYAAANGHEDILQYLILHGANINTQLNSEAKPLHITAMKGQAKAARILIENGADVDSKTYNEGNSPLHFAAINGHISVARELIRKGADLNLRNKYGRTPLHLASQYGQKDLIYYFLQSGADVNSRDNEGSTPLLLVTKYVFPEEKQLNIVEHLIKNYNANINTKDVDGSTPLSLVILNSHSKVENLLRKARSSLIKK